MKPTQQISPLFRPIRLPALWLLLTLPCAVNAIDTDQDGIDDTVDNCLLVANPNQRDTDDDGYGNWCDGDLKADGIIDWDDINRSYWYYGSVGDGSYNPEADINGDDVVDSTDSYLIKDIMNAVGFPGPSALIGTGNKNPPTISGTPADTVNVGAFYYFFPSATDIDGDALSFSIKSKPDWILFDSSTGLMLGAPSSDDVGSYTDIQIIVTDKKTAVFMPTFQIVVEDPVQSTDLDLDGIADSEDNCTLFPNPQQQDSNANGYGNFCDGDLSSNGVIDYDDVNKTYWYFGEVGDSDYNSDADYDSNGKVDNVDVSLVKFMKDTTGKPGPSGNENPPENSAPEISGAPATSIQVSSAYLFTPIASDADNDPLMFSISNKPDWLQFDSLTGGVTGTPSVANIGEYSGIQISVSDGALSSSLPAFSITVVDAPTTDRPTIAGCEIFPEYNFWNTDISDYPLHPKSNDYIAHIGGATTLHPDFGDGYRVNGELVSAYGIPYVAVSSDPAVYSASANIFKKSDIPIEFQWWDESDCQTADSAQEKICLNSAGNYPVPAEQIVASDGNVSELSKIIESGNDKHILSLDVDNCVLYEVQRYQYEINNQSLINVTGDSGAIWDLSKNVQRIPNHTSADAAGLAILPGLVKFEEVVKQYDPINGHVYGDIHHAIRVTLNNPQNAYMFPATHSDGNQLGGCAFSAESNCMPMGQRLRLKMTLEQINNSSFSEANKVILRAMRTYGLVIADTGGDLFISGDHDPRWADDAFDLNALKTLTAQNFEAIIKPEGEWVYEYSWSSGAKVFYEPEDTSPPQGDDEFEFVVFGDFNQGGCERNDRIAELLNLVVENEGSTAAFFVSTGDIIDGYLNSSGGDLSFATDLDNSICGENAHHGNINKLLSPIKERTPVEGLNASFYPAIGNHDGGWGSGWYPDPWGQGICDMLAPSVPMDYINHNVPDLMGGVLTPTPENAAQINQLFCNKQDMYSSLHPREFFYSFSYKNAHLIILSLFDDYQSLYPSQMLFLENELSNAQQQGKHIFVFAHAPLYTTNWDRHRATTNWRAYAELFTQYGVDMYFNGHNHSYERSYALKPDPNDEDAFRLDDTGTVYLTVGSAGGASDGTPDLSNPLTEVTVMIPEWSQVKTWSKSAFYREITTYVKVKVKDEQVSFEAYTIGLDDLSRINSGGNRIPMDEIILGPRKVDSGYLRKYKTE